MENIELIKHKPALNSRAAAHTHHPILIWQSEKLLQNKQINFEDKIQRTKIDFCCCIFSTENETRKNEQIRYGGSEIAAWHSMSGILVLFPCISFDCSHAIW